MNRPLPLLGGLPEPSERPLHAVAGKGFRPFFLAASAFAVALVPLWLLVLGGVVSPAAAFEPVVWHAHEMIFGFAVAVIAGFLLTAVANWTQRETLTGAPLLALATLWLAGRLVMTFGALLPRTLVTAVDLAFLPALALVLARPLIAARNRRNFVMLAVLAVLAAANAGAHLGFAHEAMRVAVDVLVFLMLVIAGRVVPMFTRNATGAATASSPWLDRATALAGMGLVVVDARWAETVAPRVVAGGLAVLAIARAARWATLRTLGHPLLWILHAGYAWMAIGLGLRALAHPSALHALTVGAVGSLTLGMMVRVTLGHTGRPLMASKPTVWALVAISLAALARVGLPLLLTDYLAALCIAGSLWTLAFLLFLGHYGPYLLAQRPDGKAG